MHIANLYDNNAKAFDTSDTQDRFKGAHKKLADEFTSQFLGIQGPTSTSSCSLGGVTPHQAARDTMSREPEPNKSVVVHPDNCLSGIRGRRDNTKGTQEKLEHGSVRTRSDEGRTCTEKRAISRSGEHDPIRGQGMRVPTTSRFTVDTNHPRPM